MDRETVMRQWDKQRRAIAGVVGCNVLSKPAVAEPVGDGRLFGLGGKIGVAAAIIVLAACGLALSQGLLAVTPPVVPPPSGGGAVSGGTYYVAPSGSDSNPGTIEAPFKTLAKAVPLLKPGDTLIVRSGEYETGGLAANGSSLIPSGVAWDKPVTLRAYPGERPVFRRYLPANYPYSEEEVRAAIHLPTYEECARFASYGLVTDFPYSCWQGSGNNQPAGGLFWQAPKGVVSGYVVDLYNLRFPTRYVVIDGVDIDAKGIVPNPIGFSDFSEHIRFQNLEIRNGVGSCITQATSLEKTHYDFDLQFFRVKIHSCGVPFDTNLINGQLARKNKNARYWHGWYLKAGGASFIESESYNHAGTGLGPDGNNIVVRNSYIHDNSAQGIYITGGDNWSLEGNIFYNNGGAEIYHFGGKNHLIAKNTLIAGPNSDAGIYIHWAGQNSTYRDNIVSGFHTAYYNSECGPSFPCFYKVGNVIKNNLFNAKTRNRDVFNIDGATLPIDGGGNLRGVDPLLDDSFAPVPGSPVIGKASDGGNIGAK